MVPVRAGTVPVRVRFMFSLVGGDNSHEPVRHLHAADAVPGPGADIGSRGAGVNAIAVSEAGNTDRRSSQYESALWIQRHRASWSAGWRLGFDAGTLRSIVERQQGRLALSRE